MKMPDPAPSPPSLATQIGRALRSRFGVPRASRRRPRGYGPALALLAAIPPLTALAAEASAALREGRNRRLEHAAAPRLTALRDARRAAAIRRRLAPLLTRPTLSDMMDRLAAALPGDARLDLVSLDADGAIEARIDCNDPDALRAALRGAPLLAPLRMVGQEPADDGVRVVLRSAAS